MKPEEYDKLVTTHDDATRIINKARIIVLVVLVFIVLFLIIMLPVQ